MDKFIKIVRLKLDDKTPLKSQPHWDLVYYIRGEGIIFIGEHAFNFHERDIFCIPPKVPYYEEPQTPSGRIILSVEHIDDFGIDIPIFHDNQDKDYLQILFLMIKCEYERAHNWKNILNTMLLLLTEFMFSWNHKIPNDSYIEICKNVIVDNISNADFTLSALFKTIPISSIYFIKLFKKETAYTPAQYLTCERINHAKRLLINRDNSSLKIKDIAKLCGYNDSLYFSKVFKKITGSSPEDFIRQT